MDTSMNLLRLKQDAITLKEMYPKKKSCLFFIDFKSAFDTVDHNKLFIKLRKFRYPERITNIAKNIYKKCTINS